MSQVFDPGDYLVFQLESGFALLRVLGVEDGVEPAWHIAAYRDLFLDVDTAESAALQGSGLVEELKHAVLTNRAFESTQVAKIGHRPLGPDELARVFDWRSSTGRVISDRSIRLMLGLR